MRIGLIRHGETDWNAQSRLQGQVDIPLNDRGLEQADDAGRLLRGHGWQRIYATPLQRSRRTAEIIADAIGLPAPELAAGLIERSFGELEGATVYDENGDRRPIDHPSVEPSDALVARTLAALDELVAANEPDAEVLVVAHGSVIRLLLTELLGWRSPHISNLAMSVIETAPEATHGFVVRSANGYPIADDLPE